MNNIRLLRSLIPASFLTWLAMATCLVIATSCTLKIVKNPANSCKPGKHYIGQVDYDFEDEFDLIPVGSITPAYPNVDVRAVVRYPATAPGVGTPIAAGRFPLVIFLHGNHATCPCSCSHACAPADRIPNHLGYNYMLDTLASRGFVAISIDGFDVTCAGSFTMSDYEARGRLVLRHLEKWVDWNDNGTDPWGGLLQYHVDMNKIGLSGHSRGGEGVVAAEYINRTEALGFKIKAINAIAPTDQDPDIHYVSEEPYFLLLAASDGDVYSLQGLRTYDRSFPITLPVQEMKTMQWIYGANHNFFNTVWTPGTGFACASDDGVGEGRLSPKLQQLTACQSIVPFFERHLKAKASHLMSVFKGDRPLEGEDGIEAYWAYQDPNRLELDNFEAGDNPGSNSLGGIVSSSGGFLTFDEFEFKPSGLDRYLNRTYRHFTHALVLEWTAPQFFLSNLPVGQQDVSQFKALSFRSGQIIGGATPDVRNPLDTSRTIRVSLVDSANNVSNSGFPVTALQSIPYPYEYNGGKTVFTTIRIPLRGFRLDNAPFPLNDVAAVRFEVEGTGLMAIDDIQFTR